jgi:hypothetical protein
MLHAKDVHCKPNVFGTGAPSRSLSESKYILRSHYVSDGL